MAAPLNTDIKNTLLNSCDKLIATKPFDSISLADVARDAGVSKGTLYHYYKSKEELLFDVTDRYLAQMDNDLMKWIGDPSKDTSFKRMARYIFQYGIYKSGGATRLHLLSACVSGNDALRQRMVQKYNHFRDTLAQRIAERKPSADAEYQAWVLLTMMDGLMVQTLLKNEAFDVGAFIEKAVWMLDSLAADE